MSSNLILILTASILFPIGISVVKFKSIANTFFPFLLLLWLSFMIDIIAFFFYRHIESIIFINIYYLVESLVVLWQFKKWYLFKIKKWYSFLVAPFIIFWIIEFALLIRSNYYEWNYFYLSYFCCLYSLLFVIFSINKISDLVTSGENQLFDNPIFIICSAFILYYTYTCIMAVFWMPNLKISIRPFNAIVYSLMYVILFICNIIYAYGIFRMIKPDVPFRRNQALCFKSTEYPSIS